MGGRGTYSAGKAPKHTYKAVDRIGDVKVLVPVDEGKALKLPGESHTAGNKYVLLDKDGVFHQYREYNCNHEVVLKIGYHHEQALGQGDVLHIHIHGKPGVDNHSSPSTIKRKLTRTEYQKYKSLFKGVKIDEGKYFS